MKLEDRLRRTLARQAGRLRLSDNAWSSIERRAEHADNPSLTSRVLAASLALAVSAAAFAVLWVAFRPDRDNTQPASAATPNAEVAPIIAATIPLGPFPRAIAVADDAVWVSVQGVGENSSSVVRVDPQTNQAEATIPVRFAPDHLVVGAGAVWGSLEGEGGSILRIDPRQERVVGTVLVGGGDYVEDVAAGEGIAWAGVVDSKDGSSSLVKIDPETNAVIAKVPLPQLSQPVIDLEVASGVVWLLGDGDLIRVDAATNQIIGTTKAAAVGTRLAVGPRDVWVQSWLSSYAETGADDSDQIVAVRLDSQTGDVLGSPIPLDGGFSPFAVDDEGVWFYGENLPGDGFVISRLNRDGLRVDESVDLEREPVDATLDAGTGTIWVANYQESVTRIELLRP